MRSRQWTRAEITEIDRLHRAGLTGRQIGLKVGRSQSAVASKLRAIAQLGLEGVCLSAVARRERSVNERLSAFDAAFARMERPARRETAFNRLPPPTLVSAGEAMS